MPRNLRAARLRYGVAKWAIPEKDQHFMLDAKAEMEALWTAVFGQPPAIDADPRLLAELILRCSAPPPVYETFARLQAEAESLIVDECPPPRSMPTAASPRG